MKAKSTIAKLEALRQQAEELMKKKLPKKATQFSGADMLKLRHELEVHQIELELQQEELIWAEEQRVNIAVGKYAELYNLAPSGYFTLSREGKILELNLNGADLLGKERLQLKNSNFGFFISDDTKPIFNHFLEKVCNSEVNETCEVILSTKNNLPVTVYLTGIATQNGEQCLINAVDISERKQREADLRESEEKYRNIFENIQYVYYETAIDGTIVEVSPSISLITKGQYKREDLIGKSMNDFYFNPTGRPALLALLQEQGSVSDYEISLKNRDGSQILCSITAKIQFNADGKPLKIVGNMIDITERKRVEYALVDSELKYRQLVSQSPDGIFVIDLSGRFISVNRIICDTLKYTGEELLSMKIWDIIPKQYHALHQQRLAAIAKGEFVQINAESEVTGKDGITHFIEILSVPYSKENKIVGFQGIAHDITKRKQDEESLFQYKQQLEFALSGTNDGIWDVKMDTGSVYISPRGCEILGYSPDGLPDTIERWNQFVHPEDLPATNDALTAYLDGNAEIFIVQQRLKTSTGEFKWILTRGKAVSYDSNGKALRLVGTHTDISEQKLVEKALHESLERYKKLTEISPVGIFHSDENGLTTFVNPTWCQITGLSFEDALGDNWLNAVHPDDKEKVVNGWREASQIHKSSYSEYRFVRPDGSISWVMGQAIPETNTEGQTIGFIGTMTDITERKNAEESTRKQIEEFETIFNLVPAQIWYKDTHNNFIRVNRQVCDDLGMTIDKIEGHSAEEIFPAFAQQYFNDDLEVFKTQRPKLGIIEQVNTSKGEIRWVHSDKVPVFGNDGKVNGLISVVQDITDRKRAEKEIAMLAHSLKSINECVSITDLDDKIFFVNDSFLKTYGYELNELVGKHISIVRSQNNLQELVKEILPATIQGEWQGELMNRRKDGSEFPIYLSTTIIKDKENQTLGLIGVATDISGRKQAEIALRDSQTLLHTLVQTIPDLIWLKDTGGVYLLCNTMFERFIGAEEANIIGKTDYDFLTRELADIFREYDRKAIAAGSPTSNEEWVTFADDGHRAFLDTIKSPMYDSEGKLIGVLGIGRDITERKRVEVELKISKAKAEEGDQLKTAFLNNISHEIRTPFNGILGFLSIIQDENLTVSERDEYINIINKSAYRLMNTINDIVEISQIQAGQMKLKESKTNIRKLISELYNRFKTEADYKGLKFNINSNIPADVEYIYSDSIKLNAILTILIGNAIKFTKTGSIEIGYQFDIETRNHVETHGRASLHDYASLQPSASLQPPAFLRFFVKDSGIGISENKLEAIFERFIQADGSNTRGFEGSGLGLTIAKAYVELMSGKIWVESEEGKGSIFYFTIPYMIEAEEDRVEKNLVSTVPADNKMKSETLGLKILIVEDNEESAILLEVIVNSIGKEILIASTSFEAVEVCRNNPDIELVLMDIKMPDMDGYEATRQIRQFNTNVIIIAQTAYAMTGDREKAINAGCNDYISKPFDRSMLIGRIKKHFKRL